MLRHLFLVTMVLILRQGTSFSAPAWQDVAELEIQFAEADSLLAETVAERDSLAQEASRLATEISELKEKGKLNYFLRNRLESLLRSSQHLSRKLDASDRRVAERQAQLHEVGTKLLEAYEKEIQARLSQLQRGGAGQRGALSADLDVLRRKQARLRQRLQQPTPPIRLVPVKIDPSDTPAEIRRKADLLRDQEDKLRARQRWLQRKTTEISEELELRQRLGEFVAEVSLFDPSEEGLSDESGRAAAELPAAGVVDRAFEASLGAQTVSGLFLTPRQWEALASPQIFSESELKELLQALKDQDRKLSVQADSLRTLARKFVETAKAYEAGKEPEPR